MNNCISQRRRKRRQNQCKPVQARAESFGCFDSGCTENCIDLELDSKSEGERVRKRRRTRMERLGASTFSHLTFRSCGSPLWAITPPAFPVFYSVFFPCSFSFLTLIFFVSLHLFIQYMRMHVFSSLAARSTLPACCI